MYRVCAPRTWRMAAWHAASGRRRMDLFHPYVRDIRIRVVNVFAALPLASTFGRPRLSNIPNKITTVMSRNEDIETSPHRKQEASRCRTDSHSQAHCGVPLFAPCRPGAGSGRSESVRGYRRSHPPLRCGLLLLIIAQSQYRAPVCPPSISMKSDAPGTGTSQPYRASVDPRQ